MNFTYGIIIFVIIICILIKYDSINSSLIHVKSSIDNAEHLVQNSSDANLASDMLARIKQKSIELCDNLQKNYPNDERVKLIINRFNPDNIMEADVEKRIHHIQSIKGRKSLYV